MTAANIIDNLQPHLKRYKMKVAGIVAEFNPLHTGHERIMTYCRESLGADAIVICMSGDFVQRGEPAVIGKYERSLAAIAPTPSAENDRGAALAPARVAADLIIGLPAIGAAANAEVFARTGVNTLLATGIVTDIVFGSEGGSTKAIEDTARLLADEPPEFKTALTAGMKAGLSYPAAMARAAAACGKEASLFEQPNDLLGVLYVKALLEYEKAHGGERISFHPVRREGAGHDEAADGNMSYTSSSAIREALLHTTRTCNESIQKSAKKRITASASQFPADLEKQRAFLPSASYDALVQAASENALVFPDDLSLLLHEKLYTEQDLTVFSDIDSDLANRILKMREDFTGFTEFAEALAARNYTRARCRRALLHIALGISDEDAAALASCNYSPYIHVLAMNARGETLLSEMKKKRKTASESAAPAFLPNTGCLGNGSVPVFCALSEPAARELTGDAAIVLQKDIFASDIYHIILTEKTKKPQKSDFSRKVLRI